MKTRLTIGILTLLGLGLCMHASAAAPGRVGRKPLTFSVKVTPQGGRPINVDCIANFGPPVPISAMAFSPNDRFLAVGGYEEVLLWDLAQARLARRIGVNQIDGMVRAVAFLDSGNTLAVGDGVPHESGSVKLMNLATGQLVSTLDDPTRVVRCMDVSVDGKFLAAGSTDSNVYIWNMNTKTLVKTIDAHADWVLGVSFSADGKQFATGSADRTMRVWEVGTWKPIIQYDVPDVVHGLAMSPDGKMVIGAVGGDGEWALRTGRIETDLALPAGRKPAPRAASTGTGMPLDIAWAGSTGNCVIGCSDGTVRACQSWSGKAIRTFSGHTDWVYSVAASSNGSLIAAGGADGSVRLWKGATAGRPIATLVQLAPGLEQWLIMTPQANYAGSSPGVVKWRRAGTRDSLKTMPTRYYNPTAIAGVLYPKKK